MKRILGLLVFHAFTTFAGIALLAAPAFAESQSKVIAMSNDTESWSSTGGASDCLDLDEELTLYGGFVNSCPFAVQYVFCAYRPNKDSWTESFDCEKGKGGYDIIGAKSQQAAHTRNAESTHWAACPWSDIDGKYLGIHFDSKWDNQRKQYVYSCLLKNADKKDKADETPVAKDEEPAALVRPDIIGGAKMMKEALNKLEKEEQEEKERIARIERERVERERLDREAQERANREQLAREAQERARLAAEADARQQAQAKAKDFQSSQISNNAGARPKNLGGKSCNDYYLQFASFVSDTQSEAIHKLHNAGVLGLHHSAQRIWFWLLNLRFVNTHPACANDTNTKKVVADELAEERKRCQYGRIKLGHSDNCDTGRDVAGVAARAEALFNQLLLEK